MVVAAVCAATAGHAQDDFAVIRDHDGYVNVRQGDVQSKIVGRITRRQPFDCWNGEDAGGTKFVDMVHVNYFDYVSGRPFASNSQTQRPRVGYIHRSRVQRLREMPALKLRSATDARAVYANDSLRVTIETVPFDAAKHKLGRGQYGVETIDGARFWGTDGGVPRRQVQSVGISGRSVPVFGRGATPGGRSATSDSRETTLIFPRESIGDLFDLSLDTATICIGAEGELYLWLQGGDGAASYHVIWIVASGRIVCRYVALSFYV
ncbi:hypothetical protein FACS1894159_05610 [Bacteroidia bacterium]|nr:hypothetical protein FACS1894159_05610 [Bacteroidia bacterium]